MAPHVRGFRLANFDYCLRNMELSSIDGYFAFSSIDSDDGTIRRW